MKRIELKTLFERAEVENPGEKSLAQHLEYQNVPVPEDGPGVFHLLHSVMVTISAPNLAAGLLSLPVSDQARLVGIMLALAPEPGCGFELVDGGSKSGATIIHMQPSTKSFCHLLITR